MKILELREYFSNFNVPMYNLEIIHLKLYILYQWNYEPCRVGPPKMDGSWGEFWQTGQGNGKPLQYPSLENPWIIWKGKMIGPWKTNSPGRQVPNMLLEVSGELTPERLKRWNQSKNNTQLWTWLVMEVKSNAVRSNIAQEPGMSGPWIKANWKW